MKSRENYIMSPEEFKELKELREDQKTNDVTIREINFWNRLAKKYSFIAVTVKRWDGMDEQHFTAVSNE